MGMKPPSVSQGPSLSQQGAAQASSEEAEHGHGQARQRGAEALDGLAGTLAFGRQGGDVEGAGGLETLLLGVAGGAG